jgi:PAS domain S-box-containing protein
MIPDKTINNQAFFYTNSLNENNLTLMKIKEHNTIQNFIHFALDMDGNIQTLEGNGLTMVDINRYDFLEKNIYNILPSDNKFLSQLKAMLLNGENSSQIKVSSYTFDIYYTYCHSINGELTGIIGTAREISLDMSIKEELKIHKGYFSQLFESSPEAIAIIDNEDRILNVNMGFENLFNYTLKEIKGKFISLIVPDALASEASKISRKACFGEIIKTETIRKRKDGSEINVSVLGYPVTLKDGQIGLYWIFSDITSRKHSEKMIRNSLLEKEILLKEVHHRVKNNLQIIGSLLKFQTKYIKDPEALEMFKESQNRVRSISLIHEKLYQTKDISRVEFAGYVKTLISQLFITFGIKAEHVSYSVKADNIFLSVDNAIPCGLIINELVTNSLKYAFPENRKGHVAIDVSYNSSHYTIKISDDGVGMPENYEVTKPESLGLQLVNTLAVQLDAQLTLERNNGTCYKLVFSNLNYKSRI